MAVLHIENTVVDYDTWKAAFDKFERFRAERGVRSYRICRKADSPNEITVDLTFDDVEAARSFIGHLEQIWKTPQSSAQLVAHSRPSVYVLAVDRELVA